MKRLVPAFIEERFAAAEGSGSFEAATLFVDVAGFTPITEALMDSGRAGAEVLARIIDEVFEPLTRAVFDAGGYVTNLAGDAFTALFPCIDGEHPACARAVAAAWRIQEAIRGASRHETPFGTFEISVKVGIDVGDVAWGVVRSEERHRAAYYFQGPAIDGCAAAEDLAAPGEIVVSGATAEALGAPVCLEPRGDHGRVVSAPADLPAAAAYAPPPVQAAIAGQFFPDEALHEVRTGEFRHVVSVFVSLPTLRTEEQLASFVQIVFELQDVYGGLLNRLSFGDKGATLVLFWGAPVAYENDVARALDFTLHLQARTVIPLNAGISFGLTHAGYSGGELAGEYTCHGRAVTLAARLMQRSTRGEIWVDERVAERARGGFELEHVGALELKGLSGAQPVYAIFERLEETGREYVGDLVGREAEAEQLRNFLQPIWSNRFAGTLAVWGDAGIGKSRFVHDVLAQLQATSDRPFSIFACPTDEVVRASLNPFVYWLRSYFEQSAQRSEGRNKRSFNRKLDDLVAGSRDPDLTGELDRTRSMLGALLDLHWPDSLFEELDAKARYENTFQALSTLLLLESARQPVILVIEDAHWLDDDSIDVLDRLRAEFEARGANAVAVLVVARSEGLERTAGQVPFAETVRLDRLSTRELSLFAQRLLGAGISQALLDFLDERAEGNPFFGQQILRHMQEEQLLTRDGDVWTMRPDAEVELPHDVDAVLVARLDRLGREVRDVVQTAAVLGREFEVRVLASMLRGEGDLLEKVAAAERSAVWSALSEMRYVFRHALLRDAAYRMQAVARRRDLHEVALTALRELYGDESARSAELAYHADEAGLAEEARRYYRLAGDVSAAAFHNAAALAQYARALELTPESDAEGRFALLRERELILDRIGEREEQGRALDAMERIAVALGDAQKQALVLVRRLWLATWLGDFAKACDAGREALVMARRAADRESEADAHRSLAWALLQRVDPECIEHAQRSLDIANEIESSELVARAHNIFGLIHVNGGNYHAAREHIRAFIEAAREQRDRESEAKGVSNLGAVEMLLGQYDAAERHFREGLDLCRDIGILDARATDLVNLCWLDVLRGDYASALEQGDAVRGRTLRGRWTTLDAEVSVWLGHARFGLGDLDGAREEYEHALRIHREAGQQHMTGSPLAGLAQVAQASGDLSTAVGYIEEILEHLASGGTLEGTFEPFQIQQICAQILESASDPRARAIWQGAAAELHRQADLIPDAEERRVFLEEVSAHRAILSACAER